MHSISEVGSNVPAFLGKLWTMVEDPDTNDLISWSSNGTSFVIKDEIRFARELLPMYYKHNNMASFIRQLNMYGFHKIVSPEAGAMKWEAADEIQFSHPFFIRGHSYLLDDIKRKITVNKTVPGQFGEKSSTQVLGKVLTDVRQMKGRQENMDSKLTAMKLENGALWRELSVLRQKHMKQQQMVNKLIQFLVTLVHQNPKLFSMKRKYPRMLHENNLIEIGKHQQHHEDSASNPTNSPAGPIIHELDPAETLMDTVAVEAEVETEPVSPSQVSHYFLNETCDSEEDVVVEMPFAEVGDKSNPETIIGIPEDTLQQINLSKNSPTVVFSAEQINKQAQRVKSNYDVNVVTGKPKNDIGFNQRIQKSQQIVMKNQQNTKQNLQYQIQMNQQLIQRNREQIDKSEELKRNQQRILKSQQEIIKSRQIILKNHQEIINNQQEILESQQKPNISNTVVQFQNNQNQMGKRNQQKLIRSQQVKKRRPTEKYQQDILVKNQQRQLRKNQQQKNKQHNFQSSPYQQVPNSPLENNLQQLLKGSEENILLDKIQQDVQPLESIIIDNSPGESILDVDGNPVYAEADNQDLSIIVEIPALEDLQDQQHSSPPVTQDLLLGTPLMLNDSVLTPQSTATAVPTTSSPDPSSLNMEVACLEESEITTPNIITREDMDNHLDTMQSDLDNLKELLRSEGISLDANALLSCFNEDPLSYNMSDPVPADDPNRPKENNGNELMAYNAPLLDFSDILGAEWSLPASPNNHQPTDNSFEEIHTPQFVPQSPSFPVSSKRRKT